MTSSLEDWITKQKVASLEHKLNDPEFQGDRAEVQRQLVELRKKLTPPRRPLFRL